MGSSRTPESILRRPSRISPSVSRSIFNAMHGREDRPPVLHETQDLRRFFGDDRTRVYTAGISRPARLDPITRTTIPADNQLQRILSDTYIFGPTRSTSFRLGLTGAPSTCCRMSNEPNWSQQLASQCDRKRVPGFQHGSYLTLGRLASSRPRPDRAGQFHTDRRKAHVKVGYEMIRTT